MLDMHGKARNQKDGDTEMEESKEYIIVEIMECVPETVLRRTIVRKTTGNTTVIQSGHA